MASRPVPARFPVRDSAAHAQPAGVLAALVLTVLMTGVVSATMLGQAAAGPPPLADAAVTEPVVARSVVVAAGVAAAAPAAAPPPGPVRSEELAPAPPAPPPAAEPVPPAEPAAPARPVDLPAAPPAAPAPAPAPVDPLCSGDGWEQRRGEAALASLRRPGDASSFRISYEAGRSDVLGLATVHEGRMQVFVRSCDALSRSLLAHVVAHELGHLLDGARMDDDLRAQWLAARGIAPDTPWYGCNSCIDFASPAGDFAEVYAQWQTGAGSNRSQLAPPPSPGQLADLAARFF